MNGEEFGSGCHLYTLQNEYLTLKVTDLGAAIVSLLVRDRQGKKIDVVLGYENAADYCEDRGYYFGGTVGRYANRIHNAAFKLNGRQFTLDKNNGENTLHGGFNSWTKRQFSLVKTNDKFLVLTLLSPDGDQGFPGELNLQITYTLHRDRVKITYEATSSSDTPVNITNHSYFNLTGHDSGPILDHLLQIAADCYTPTDENLIPDGTVVAINDTPLDFRHGKLIKDDIKKDYRPLIIAGGYDHNFVLNSPENADALKLFSAVSGISMAVRTDYPGLQIYTGNYLENIKGKNRAVYDRYSGIAIEPQFFPDSPNQIGFPSTILSAGKKYTKFIEYRFSSD